MKGKVRELWRTCQSLSREQLLDRWCAYIRGWWAYCQPGRGSSQHFPDGVEDSPSHPLLFLASWHSPQGHLRHLRRLGVVGQLAQAARSTTGA